MVAPLTDELLESRWRRLEVVTMKREDVYRQQLKQLETIAKYLKGGWRVDKRQHRLPSLFRLISGNKKMFIRVEYDRGRIFFTGYSSTNNAIKVYTTSTVTVSQQRSYRSIANDLNRRFVPQCDELLNDVDAALARVKEKKANDFRFNIEHLMKAAGFVDFRSQSYQLAFESRFKTATGHDGLVVIDRDSKVDLSIKSISPEAAIKLCYYLNSGELAG